METRFLRWLSDWIEKLAIYAILNFHPAYVGRSCIVGSSM